MYETLLLLKTLQEAIDVVAQCPSQYAEKAKETIENIKLCQFWILLGMIVDKLNDYQSKNYYKWKHSRYNRQHYKEL